MQSFVIINIDTKKKHKVKGYKAVSKIVGSTFATVDYHFGRMKKTVKVFNDKFKVEKID